MLNYKKSGFGNLCTFFVLVILTASQISCKIKNDPVADAKEKRLHANAMAIHEYTLNVAKEKKAAYENFMNQLSFEEKVFQLFIENLDGKSVFHPKESIEVNGKKIDVIPGGYLFFAFNLAEDPQGIISFTNSIQNYCIDNSYVRPFLAIDHEGGPVNRLRNINAPLPSCEVIGKSYTLEEASRIYEYQALQMQNLGFTMNLAPVVEVCSDDNKDFLSGRSFGDAKATLVYSTVCVRAYEDNGVSTVLKHFPGNTNTDPHSGLPEIKLSEEEIRKTLEPFIEVLKEKPAAVLMSHAIVESVDPKTPSCLSEKWVTDILRNELNFQGVIFSDDIFMAALKNNGFTTDKAVVMAIEAGIDCIMISGKEIAVPVKVLLEKAEKDAAFKNKLEVAAKRIIDYKIETGLLAYVPHKDGTYTIENAGLKKTPQQQLEQFNIAKKLNNEEYKRGM